MSADETGAATPHYEDPRLKRLSFRSWHRGFKEADLMLGHFCDQHLGSLTPQQLDRYEALLGVDCHDLYNWIVGRDPVPAEHDHDVMEMLRRFDHLKEAMWPAVAAKPS